mmetsp:Transcript_28614/g.65916  ORF Transcript_28614/g.65916 Transcript_28614/m.65916 type:complete len:2199 (+) Transcript_28614:31-6627(+)
MLFFSRAANEAAAVWAGVFSVIYVMFEALPSHVSLAHWVWAIFLILVDFAQVIRDMMRQEFGWRSGESWFPELYTSTNAEVILGLTLNGKRALSVLCNLLIAGVLVNTVYVVIEFRTMRFDRIWATKLLRSLGTFCVTALYPTIFEYGVKAATCEFWVINAKEEDCEILSQGRIVLAVASGCLMSFFFIFGFVVSLYFREINPLSQDPLSAFLGRAEASYQVMKTLLIIVPLLPAPHVPLFVAFLAIMSYVTMLVHLYEQPFHSWRVNSIRGAMFGASSGMCTCSLMAVHNVQYATYFALVLTPLFAFAGAGLCAVRRRSAVRNSASLHATLYRMVPAVPVHRHDRKTSTAGLTSIPAPSSALPPLPTSSNGQGSNRDLESSSTPVDSSTPGPNPESHDTNGAPVPLSPLAGPRIRKGVTVRSNDFNSFRQGFLDSPTASSNPAAIGLPTPLDHGIDPKVVETPGVRGVAASTLGDSFFSDRGGPDGMWWCDLDAVVAVRHLIAAGNHSLADLEKIKKILVGTLERETSATYTALWLAAFSLFVLRDYVLCSQILDKLEDSKLMFEAVFLRFAIRKKMMQVMKSPTLGSEMTAIGMMEVSKEQENAVRYHTDAVHHLHLFWRDVSLGRDSLLISGRLDSFFRSCDRARTAFEELASKFPNSPALLRATAQFLEDVMSANLSATEMRGRADQIEDLNSAVDGPIDPVNSQRSGTYEHSSVSDNRQRILASDDWTQSVLQREVRSLEAAAIKVRWAIVAMIFFLTVAFLVLDLALFSGSAETGITEIARINHARTALVSSLSALRDMVSVAALSHCNGVSADKVAGAVAHVRATAERMTEALLDVFENTDETVRNSMQGDLFMRAPRPHGWWKYKYSDLFGSLRSFGQDMVSASETPIDLLVSPQFWYENTTHPLIQQLLATTYNAEQPLLAELDRMAILLEFSIQRFADNVYMAIGFNAAAVIVLSVFVVSIVERTVGRATIYMRAATTVTAVVCHVPTRNCRHLMHHYRSIELRLMEHDAGHPSLTNEEVPPDLAVASGANYSPCGSPMTPHQTPPRTPYRHVSPQSSFATLARKASGSDKRKAPPLEGSVFDEACEAVLGKQHSETAPKISTIAEAVQALGYGVPEANGTSERSSLPMLVPIVPAATNSAPELQAPPPLPAIPSVGSGLGTARPEIPGTPLLDSEAPTVTGNRDGKSSSETSDGQHQGSNEGDAVPPKVLQLQDLVGAPMQDSSELVQRFLQGSEGNSYPPPMPSPRPWTGTEAKFPTKAALVPLPKPLDTPQGNGHGQHGGNSAANSEAGDDEPADEVFAGDDQAKTAKGSIRFSSKNQVHANRQEPLRPPKQQNKSRAVAKQVLLAWMLLLAFSIITQSLTKESSGSGPLAQQYLETSRFLADILPPPAFAIESYLQVLFFSLMSGAERQPVMDSYHGLELDFGRRIEYWGVKFTSDQRREWVKQVDSSGKRLFTTVHTELFPAMVSGDPELLREAYFKTRTAYEMHETEVKVVYEQSVEAQGVAKEKLEVSARAMVDRGIAVTIVIALAMLVLVLLMYYSEGSVKTALRRVSDITPRKVARHMHLLYIRLLRRRSSDDDGPIPGTVSPLPFQTSLRSSRRASASVSAGSVPGSPKSADHSHHGLTRTHSMSSLHSATSGDAQEARWRRQVSVVLFAVGLGIMAIVASFDAEALFVISEEFQELVSLEEWIADIAPPDAYYIEGCMVVIQAIVFDDDVDQERIKGLNEAFDRRYALWSTRLGGALSRSFMVDGHSPGKRLHSAATEHLPAAREQGPAAVKKLSERILFDWAAHDSAIRESSNLAKLRIDSLLASLDNMVLLTRMVIPAMAAVMVVCYACLMWILLNTHDTTTRRLREVEASSPVFAARLKNLRRKLHQNAPMFMWTSVQWAVYVLLPCLSVMSVTLPLRHLDPITNLAPLVNQVNRRHVYTMLAIHSLREAGYGDYLSGHDASWLAHSAIQRGDAVMSMDSAIREGGDLNIRRGTDHHFPRVDDIMYKPGGEIPLQPSDPFYSFVSGGLYHAIDSSLSLVAEIGKTVTKSAQEPPEGSSLRLVEDTGGVMQIVGLMQVPNCANDMWTLSPDAKSAVHVLGAEVLHYIDQRSVVVEEELGSAFTELFSAVHVEMRLLFCVNIGFVLFVFFFAVFRQTVSALITDVIRTRRFVEYMPLDSLPSIIVSTIRQTFSDED